MRHSFLRETENTWPNGGAAVPKATECPRCHGQSVARQRAFILAIKHQLFYYQVVGGFDLQLEWDPKKAESNIRKHGVTFTLAGTVVRDPLALTERDEAHGGSEERWLTVGRAINGECLTVAHTWVELGPNSAKARIISARRAMNYERERYEEGL